MARFGVPEDVDLRLLRDYLRREGAAFPLFFELFPTLRLLPRAGLLRVEGEIGLPPRTWLQTVLGERVLIATLLLVLLCGLAVARSPGTQGTGLPTAGT